MEKTFKDYLVEAKEKKSDVFNKDLVEDLEEETSVNNLLRISKKGKNIKFADGDSSGKSGPYKIYKYDGSKITPIEETISRSDFNKIWEKQYE